MTPHHSFSLFSAFSALSAMVLLDNTLRDDAGKGPASHLRTGPEQAGEPAGRAHPRRRISDRRYREDRVVATADYTDPTPQFLPFLRFLRFLRHGVTG